MRRHLISGRAFACSAIALATLLAPQSSGEELPPEIQVDRLLVHAEREIEDGEHWCAVFTLERVLDVHKEHGLKIPTEFWFRQAGVFQSAGPHERAVEASTRYLREAGREGEHYRRHCRSWMRQRSIWGRPNGRRHGQGPLPKRAEREARARAAVIAGSVPEMVEIPAGRFRMGWLTRARI